MLYINAAKRYANDFPLPKGASIIALSLCMSCSRMISDKYSCCGRYVRLSDLTTSLYKSLSDPLNDVLGAFKSICFYKLFVRIDRIDYLKVNFHVDVPFQTRH